MAKQDYYPGKLGDQKNWLFNYRNQISTHGPTLGMTPGEVTNNVTAADNQITLVDNAITAENAFKAAIDSRDDGAKVNVKLIRDASKRNKTSSAYTTTIGDFLGIEGPETTFDEVNFKPEGSANAVLNVVTIKFKKDGCQRMAIYSRVIAGAVTTIPMPGGPGAPPTAGEIGQFTKLAEDTYSPYVDNRPYAVNGQPETREYYFRGMLNDVEIGVPGNVIRVSVGTV